MVTRHPIKFVSLRGYLQPTNSIFRKRFFTSGLMTASLKSVGTIPPLKDAWLTIMASVQPMHHCQTLIHQFGPLDINQYSNNVTKAQDRGNIPILLVIIRDKQQPPCSLFFSHVTCSSSSHTLIIPHTQHFISKLTMVNTNQIPSQSWFAIALESFILNCGQKGKPD